MGIVAERLSKRYGARPVLADLDLTVERGEIVGIHGANASGKSTLVQLLAGVLRPDGGRVTLDGVDLMGSPARAKRGLTAVFQETFFDQRWRPAPALVAHGRFYHGRRGPDEIRSILLDLGILDKDLRKPIFQLSGGSKKKVEFAKCLISDTPCLLLDEPFAGFDAASREIGYGFLGQFRDQGKAVLWCDHDPRALQLADRVLNLEEGHLVPRSLQEAEASLTMEAEVRGWRDERKHDLLALPRISSVEVRNAPMSDDEVGTLLQKAGIDPTGKSVQVMHVDGDADQLLEKLGLAQGAAQVLSTPGAYRSHVILTIALRPTRAMTGETDSEWLRGILTDLGLTILRLEPIEGIA